jgi:hypothetical protein
MMLSVLQAACHLFLPAKPRFWLRMIRVFVANVLFASMLTRMIARVTRKLDGNVAFLESNTARKARFGLQAPGQVELVVFLIVRLGERVSPFTHINMAGGAGSHHLARMLDSHAML